VVTLVIVKLQHNRPVNSIGRYFHRKSAHNKTQIAAYCRKSHPSAGVSTTPVYQVFVAPAKPRSWTFRRACRCEEFLISAGFIAVEAVFAFFFDGDS